MHKLRSLAAGSLVVLAFSIPLFASAQSSDIQAQISALLAQITQLQAQLKAAQGGGSTTIDVNDNENGGSASVSSCPTITRTLWRGQTDLGTDGQVTALQGFLSDYFNLSDPITSGYFGAMTLKYVKLFQAQNGIEQVGYAGKLTRAAIAQTCAGTPTGVKDGDTNPQQSLDTETLITTPGDGVVPLSVTVSATAGGPGYLVDFGDGISGGIYQVPNCVKYCYAAPAHTYNAVGTYTLKLRHAPNCNSVTGANCAPDASSQTVATGIVDVKANSSPSQGITVTAPNGGEQWEQSVLNTVTWTPYQYNPDINPSRDVTAYLETKNSDGSFTTLGRVEESGKASIHWYVGYLNQASGPTVIAAPGSYYVRVVNNVTGATDRSDAPFTIVSPPVDLKVNGSDGPLTIADLTQPLTVSWTTTPGVSTCQLGGFTDVSYSTVQPSSGSLTAHVSYGTDYNGNIYVSGIYMQCVRNGAMVSDSVTVKTNTPITTSLVQVVTPNGGELVDPSQPMYVNYKFSGVNKISVALYKNDQWKYWIAKDVQVSGINQGATLWYPGNTLQGLGDGDNAGAIFKMYVTAQKADGSGYVDDKSDAPFSFKSSAAGTPTISVISAAGGQIGVSYANLPTSNIQGIYVTSQSTGTNVTSQPTGGGNGTTYIQMPASSPSGNYTLRVLAVINNTIIAQSAPFYYAGATCVAPHITNLATIGTSPNQGLGIGYKADQTVTWSSPNLPSWASFLNSTTGANGQSTGDVYIASSPSIGSYSFTIAATNSCGASDTEIQNVVSSNGTVVIDQNALTSSSATPTITGSSYNVAAVGVVLSNSGGKVFGSGMIGVQGGRWSTTVTPALTVGSYNVTVMNYFSNVVLATGTLTITASTPQPTTAQTNPVVMNYFYADSSSVSVGQPVQLYYSSNVQSSDMTQYGGSCWLTPNVNGTDMTTINLNYTGGTYRYTPSAAGTHVLTVRCASGGKTGDPSASKSLTVNAS